MDKVDCVVVGAGPAGSSCAIGLARKGIKTVLLERGREAGGKNVASFVLFTDVLRMIIPEFEDEAPLERVVTDNSFICLFNKDFLEFRMRFSDFSEKRSAYTAYRSKFDKWFAQKAEEEGVELIRGVLVTGLLKEKGRVVGVRIGNEEILADVVVGADGVLSVVSRDSGLYEDDTSRYKLGIKEVLDLPPEIIEERFQLSKGEGCIKDGWGYPLSDVGGVFSLYTNTDSISIAVFAPIDSIRQGRVNLRQRLEEFKAHPYINSLLIGSSLREYEAHILSDGGRLKLKRLYSDGVILCGEAGGFMSSTWVGVPPAMLSGLKAAEAVALAKRRGRYDAESLSCYADLLRQTGLPRTLYNARRFSNLIVSLKGEQIEKLNCNLIRLTEDFTLGEIDFLSPGSSPMLSRIFDDFVMEFLPKYLRYPLKTIVKSLANLLVLIKKVKIRRSV